MKIIHIINILIVMSVLYIVPQKIFKPILLFMLLIFSLVDGTRYESYFDWDSYYNHFYFGKLENQMEVGYNYLVNLFRYLFNYNFLLFTISFCIYFGSFYYIYKLTKNRLSILIMFTLILPYLGVNRQLISIVILTYSINYIINKKFITFLLIVILASLFHISSLVMIPVYFIKKFQIKYTKKRIILINLVMIFFIFIGGQIKEVIILLSNNVLFFSKFKYYLNLSTKDTLSLIPLIVRNLEILIPILISNLKIKNKNSELKDLGYKGLLYSYAIYLISYGNFQIMIRSILTLRVLFMPLYYCCVLNEIENKRKKILTTIIVIIIIMSNFFKAILGKEKHQYKYKNIIFEKTLSRKEIK